MKIRHCLYIVIPLFLAACSEELDDQSLQVAHPELIGRGVNFSASRAEPFVTRTSYRRDGTFNENDILTIYRQYSEDGGITFNAASEAYRVYWLNTKYATGTSFTLETDWVPMPGAYGQNKPEEPFAQTAADSLTWENGKTVRFRAWSRSNVAGAIFHGAPNKGYYYPDYSVSEWVTVSGPTIDVPLTLKHQGCRIEFQAHGGNELVRAEICTEIEDYRWKDNADSLKFDNSAAEHGKSLTQATLERDSVVAVYNRMCIPAGADVENALLTTMTKTLYDTTDDFRDISNSPTGIVAFGTKTSAEIASDVQRPVFCMNDGRLDLITIPYDMSSEEHRGEMLVLPACTRIKVWLFDVNSGDDGSGNEGEESACHVFTLGDIMDKERGKGDTPPVQLFPNGMELKPGYSYKFYVGYHYDQLTITPADNFSWDVQDAEAGSAADQVQELPDNPTPYKWWKDAITEAIPKNISESYNPQFHITNEAEFLEFINLVNGTAVTSYVKANPLVYALRPEKNYNQKNPALPSDYRWWKAADIVDGKVVEDADSVTQEEAIAAGYILYDHYHPRVGDQPAYTVQDYVSNPFPFYDENLSRRFTVWLDCDLDLRDWLLDPIGNIPSAASSTDSCTR